MENGTVGFNKDPLDRSGGSCPTFGPNGGANDSDNDNGDDNDDDDNGDANDDGNDDGNDDCGDDNNGEIGVDVAGDTPQIGGVQPELCEQLISGDE